MRILVVAESINVEDSSASKVNMALISNLQKAGYVLKVLHYSHVDIKLDGIECTLMKGSKFSLMFFLSQFVISFRRFTNIPINKEVEGIFGFSFTHTNDTLSIKKHIKKSLDFQPDLVLTLSKGGSFRPHRALLKIPELHSKWMAYMHDPYPFHMYPRPYSHVEKGYKLKEAFMRSVSEKCHFMAFPSLLLKDWMASYFPAINSNYVIIPHQIKIEKATEEIGFPDFFNPNQFNLLHAGSLLYQRTSKYLLEAFVQFLEKNPNAQKDAVLYLIGNYDHHKAALKVYQNHPNIVIKNHIEYKTIQLLEKSVTANIILEAVSEISPFLPGKFPNCVIADKPIIALGPFYSEVKRLLGEDYEYWSEANDVASIQNIIQKLYDLWSKSATELRLNRKDLVDYSTEVYLKQTMDNLKF